MQETNEYMKKTKLLLIGVMTTFCLAGCIDKSEHDTNYDANNTSGLVVLCTHYLGSDHSTSVKFIHDTYTDNIYLKSLDLHGESMSPYYNAEGKIMKYDEFTQVHKH